MKLRLVSDFRDYYDHWFDLDGQPFERIAVGGMSRPEMLAYLDTLDLTAPRHGTVRELATEGFPLVVYTDERAHRGEGKQVMLPWDAEREYPDTFAARYYGGLTICPITAYWPTAEHNHHEQKCRSSTLRYLTVGRRTWVLGYWSDTDWRSNCGEGGVCVLDEMSPLSIKWRGIREKVGLPLWAFDAILTESQEIAVDFNIAPGLRGTGMEDVLSPAEVVDLLKEALTALHPVS
jgi:hypothetical protein